MRRGDVLKRGDAIARLESADAEIALRNAEAALAQSQADLANLQKGRRPEEIAALEASLKAAQVTAADAGRTFQRRQNLLDRGYASQADFDAAKTALDVADARVNELSANLAVAKLSARADEIAAAEARVAQARATRDTAQWRLSPAQPARSRRRLCLRHRPPRRRRRRPEAPVVSFLPEGAVKLKLYVPEAASPGSPSARR